MISWLGLAVVLWLFRYVRLVVNCISHWTFRPIPIPETPTYFSEDVTIILPTIATGGDELETTLRTCLATEPHELLLVTTNANVPNLLRVAEKMKNKRIRILSVGAANKRRQMCRAIPEVQTRITIFVDDDVTWPRKVLQWMLAPFEDPEVGGVGTSQRLKRDERITGLGRIVPFLGAAYLERRNFDCSACLHIDGGLPCLSGRTVAYRSSILQDDAFTHGFTNETWFNRQLNADDDNFITRWLYAKKWKIAMQYHKEAEVQTTLESGPKYVNQCLRWIRSNWRSNLTSMFVERHYWRTQTWSTYSVLLTTVTAWSIPIDFLLVYSWHQASRVWPSDCRTAVLAFILVWTFVFSKTVKLWGHYLRYPGDVLLFPTYLIFGYVHCLFKLWGLMTLNSTTWGSRDGADSDDGMRMIKLPSYHSAAAADARASETFGYPGEASVDGLPAYDTHQNEKTPFMTPYPA